MSLVWVYVYKLDGGPFDDQKVWRIRTVWISRLSHKLTFFITLNTHTHR